MAIRIALISANRHCEPYPVYPLGTAYLKSYLMKEIDDAQVDVVDMNLTSDDELSSYLKRERPHYIGLSIRNVDGANSLDRRGFLPSYKHIASVVRQASSSPLIIGGAAFSIFPELFMREIGADYGIKGEGEAALCELIKSLQEGREVSHIGDLYNSEGRCLAPRTQYLVTPQACYEPHLVEYYWKMSGMLNIQTKRGCPYNCIYCTYPQIDGRSVRNVAIESVVDTMARAKREYGVNYWFFTDSVFNISPSYNAALAEAIIAEGLDISWGAYFTPSNITDEELSLYKRAGLTHIEFGTESFCDQTLEAYGKRFTFDKVLEASEIALKNNIYYSHFLILAGWGESRTTLAQSIENSKLLRHTVIFPYVGMRIYPSTLLQSCCVESGVLSREDNLLEPRYYISPDFDLEECRAMAESSGKAWIFPDAEPSEMMTMLKVKRNKKGPLWEYLRRP
ncbi:MAG: lipid biosynthesis B12-binding/radical SAM protein [Rikenellaceae bacterium]